MSQDAGLLYFTGAIRCLRCGLTMEVIGWNRLHRHIGCCVCGQPNTLLKERDAAGDFVSPHRLTDMEKRIQAKLKALESKAAPKRRARRAETAEDARRADIETARKLSGR